MDENVVHESPYIIEMRNITKIFPGIIANDNITLQLKKVKFMPFWVKMVLVRVL